jgi:hypothetical protein
MPAASIMMMLIKIWIGATITKVNHHQISVNAKPI